MKPPRYFVLILAALLFSGCAQPILGPSALRQNPAPAAAEPTAPEVSTPPPEAPAALDTESTPSPVTPPAPATVSKPAPDPAPPAGPASPAVPDASPATPPVVQAAPAPARSATTPPPKAPPEKNNAAPSENGNGEGNNGKSVQASLDEALDFCQAAQDFWQKGELESALEALDQAYSLILNVDTYDDPKLIQQKEDLRFLISKRILEIYASRNIVVNGGHNAIPIQLNAYVLKEIELFTKGRERNFFIQSYQRAGRYLRQIEKAFEAAGLPLELAWLPLIESGFKEKALSKARALGLWQFIPSTGYKFGLKRDQYIDERIDPVKSTQAAIAYLKELHSIFGDWATVLAAYNCGEGRVLRVIRSQNVNYLDNFWDLFERLPFETARYVPRFLATLHILKNLETYGMQNLELEAPLAYDTVTVHRQVQLRDIAAMIGTSEKVLAELNPELRYKILPPDRYPLRVPPEKGPVLLGQLDKIPVSYPPRPAYLYHRVRPGETLSTIATRYHTSVKKIMRANDLRKSNYIVAGKKLKIPQRGTIITRALAEPQEVPAEGATHVVKSGDSLWILANRYGTTTEKIQQENGLNSTMLSIGQVIKIPGQPEEAKVENGLKTYMVKRGDSPYRIASLHNMPLERFLRINRLTPRSKIYPGQELTVE